MESFSLLKYWRGGGGAASVAAAFRPSTPAPAAALIRPSSASADDGKEEDDGPFFDLVFSTLPVDAGEAAEEGGDRPTGFFPSDNLFFEGKLVPLPPTSLVVAAASDCAKPHLAAVSFLRSATKFRVFLLGLRKPKLAAAEQPNAAAFAAAAAAAAGSPGRPPQPHQGRFFVKFKAEDVPIVSFFTRDAPKASAEGSTADAAAEERRFAGEIMHKYLSVIKPLYARASRRYGEKLRLHGVAMPAREEVSAGGAVSAGKGLRHVGKRRPAQGFIAVLPSLPPQRRDDTLREQQDGIQSAIAHCKRSLVGNGGEREVPAVVAGGF